MSDKTHFWGRKHLLKSGREIDLSAEQASGKLLITLQLNHLDPVQEIEKPVSILFSCPLELEAGEGSLSIECRGGAPAEGRPLSESELLLDGLNGSDKSLQLSELIEICALLGEYKKKLNA